MKNICKWLAYSFMQNFHCESDKLCILGYDLGSCVAAVAVYNEHGVPICHLVSFNDDWDDEMIDNCEFVRMTDIPMMLVESPHNCFKLFSLLVDDAVAAVWLGCQNRGFNLFAIDKDAENVAPVKV